MSQHDFSETLLPPDIVANNLRLIQTRWAAGAAVLVAAFLSVHIAGLPLPELPLYAVGLVILAYNLALWRVCVTDAAQADYHRVERLVRLQIVLDWLSMTVFVYLTGGILSPALFFFFLHVIIVTILLPGQSPYVYVTAVLVLLGLVVGIEAAGLLPHQIYLPGLPAHLYTDPGFIAIRLVFLAVGLFAAAFITASIMEPLRHRQRLLAALFQSVQAVSATLELSVVLDKLASSLLYALNADGVAIRLLTRDRRALERTAAVGVGRYATERIRLRDSAPYRAVIEGATRVLDSHEIPGELAPNAANIQSALLVPISSGETLGVLAIYSRRSDSTTPEALSFARAVADEGAVAIQHALAHEALQQAEKQRAQFVRIVTHELRAPVTGAQSLLRVMLAQMTGSLTDQQTDMLNRLNRRMESLLVLINDLLSLAAGRAHDMQQPLAPVTLNTLLRQALQDHEYSAREKQITLKADIPDTDLAVLATTDGLNRILTNVIGNAVKYTLAQGAVCVALAQVDDRVQVRVQDTGIGIPEEALAKLGQEFYRAANAKESGIVGTGLGLATVKQLVEGYGGELRIDSTLGSGTTVTLDFPAYEAHEGQPA